MKHFDWRSLPIIIILCMMLTSGSYTNALTVGSEGEIPISSVNRLDITSGSIVGERAEYTITIPPRWASFLIADRERQANGSHVSSSHINGSHINGSHIIEKINFYYEPTDKVSKHVYLASILVQASEYASEIKDAVKLYETNMYIFWLVAATVNPLVQITDHGIFQQFLRDVEDTELIAGFISTPKNQWEIQHNTIKVNGKQLKSKSVVRDVGLVFLPLREVCEELGYKVMWYNLDRTATVERELRFDVVVASESFDDEQNERQNFKAYMEDGRCYVSMVFFIRNLALRVEVDENNNVFLSDWTG